MCLHILCFRRANALACEARQTGRCLIKWYCPLTVKLLKELLLTRLRKLFVDSFVFEQLAVAEPVGDFFLGLG
jgi:hypothetical protein